MPIGERLVGVGATLFPIQLPGNVQPGKRKPMAQVFVPAIHGRDSGSALHSWLPNHPRPGCCGTLDTEWTDGWWFYLCVYFLLFERERGERKKLFHLLSSRCADWIRTLEQPALELALQCRCHKQWFHPLYTCHLYEWQASILLEIAIIFMLFYWFIAFVVMNVPTGMVTWQTTPRSQSSCRLL